MTIRNTARLVAAWAAPLAALAQTPPPVPASLSPTTDIQGLQQALRDLRNEYEARLKTLEERLSNAERAASVSAAHPSTDTVTAPVPSAMAPTSQGGNAFNPEIGLILSGRYAHTSRDPALDAVPGFVWPTGGGMGPGPRGFGLAESELSLSANIDPWWRGNANIALHPDDSVSVEQAYVQSTGLGSGFALKAGRFYSGIGYLNPQHAHAWDFVDNPLAYQAFLGTQYANDGVQLRWLAPTERYLELGAELGRGSNFPGNDTNRNGVGSAALSVHTGADVGDSHNWRAGASVLQTRANDLALTSSDANGSPLDSRFQGNTRVWIVDGVWKWAPHGNGTRTYFQLQGEYLRSERSGTLEQAGVTDAAQMKQSGWYLQGVYKFMPRWRLGLRTERLSPGSNALGLNNGLLTPSSERLSKNSVMLDYNPSEFSRWRVQLAQDRARLGQADRQIFLQYQMSLGAHGAHTY